MSTPEDLGIFHSDLIHNTVSVYVAGPFIGVSSWETHINTIKAETESARIWQCCGEGVLILTPHLNSGNMVGVCNERTFINAYLKAVGMCDCLLALEGWENSKGTKGEIIRALELRKRIFFNTGSVIKWILDPNRLAITKGNRKCQCCGLVVQPEEVFYYHHHKVCDGCLNNIWHEARYQPAEIRDRMKRRGYDV